MCEKRVYDLDRFVRAQEPVFATALTELRAGKKQTHWMWFVFPQLRGLGRSQMAQHYGISSFGEAVAYLEHPVLGCAYRKSNLTRQWADIGRWFGRWRTFSG